ncbi:MAG: hypothetical protein P3A28_06190 [Gemmatimonadota bacterium]|nr:hypothetical protein [Gemmatimonadota bacterium]
MNTLFRRLRGTVGVGLTWAVAYSAIFLTLGVVISIIDPDSIDPGEAVSLVTLIGATVGFVSGCISGLVLAAAERNKTLADLSIARMALWGALSAAVWPFITPVDNMMVVILAPVGAACAAGTLIIARRAGLPAPEQSPQLRDPLAGR